MRILCYSVLRLHSYYKSSAIRYIKNISFLIAFGCVIATAVALASPETKAVDPTVPANGSGCGCYDKKTQADQAKKNCILKRFISYYEPIKNFNPSALQLI